MFQLTSNLHSLVATACIVFFFGLFTLLRIFVNDQEIKHKMFKPVFFGWPIIFCFIIYLAGHIERPPLHESLLDFYEKDPNIKETQYIVDEVYTNKEIVIDHKYYRNCKFSNSTLIFEGNGSSYHYGSMFDNVIVNSEKLADLKIRKSNMVTHDDQITNKD